MKKLLMVDPPNGWKYGFPKPLPPHATIHYGGHDYGVSKNFNVIEWILENGYSQEEIDICGNSFYCKYFTTEAGINEELVGEDVNEQLGKLIYSGQLFSKDLGK